LIFRGLPRVHASDVAVWRITDERDRLRLDRLESRFRSISLIAYVPEIIGSFAGSEGKGESANPAAQARNCPLGSLAQIGLELTEGHLDRVQVGRIFGQIAKCCAARFDRLADADSLVGGTFPVMAPSIVCDALMP
jgi:hypothetical protein